MKKLLVLLLFLGFFVFARSDVFAAISVPTPAFPPDWNSKCAVSDIADNGGVCYNNYVYYACQSGPLCSSTGDLHLARLVCMNGAVPNGSQETVPPDGYKYLFYYSSGSLAGFASQAISVKGCQWMLDWAYVSGSWSTGNVVNGGDILKIDPSDTLNNNIVSNVDFISYGGHNYGGNYGSLGQVADTEILTGSNSAQLQNTAPNPVCSTLDLICQVKQFLTRLFFVPSDFATSKFEDLQEEFLGKAPFAYFASAFDLDLSDVPSTSTPTFSMPLFAEYQGHTTIDTTMSLTDTNGTVAFLISLVKPALTILCWLIFILYIIAVSRKVFE